MEIKNRNKPDDRSDNVQKIKDNIENAKLNTELAEEMLSKTDNPRNREQLKEKNRRREKAIEGLKEELKDEQEYQNQKGL
ncbi:small acid-soluble spore protein Tlp [Mycoplasmatota bacterium WC44]